MNRIPRTYKMLFTAIRVNVGYMLTRIGRGFGLVDTMAVLIHIEATHQTMSLLAIITIKPMRFAASMTAKPIH